MNIPNVKKIRKSRKPIYTDDISLDMLDSVIKSGADPIEMMAQMKKALMKRIMEAELNHHLYQSLLKMRNLLQ